MTLEVRFQPEPEPTRIFVGHEVFDISKDPKYVHIEAEKPYPIHV